MAMLSYIDLMDDKEYVLVENTALALDDNLMGILLTEHINKGARKLMVRGVDNIDEAGYIYDFILLHEGKCDMVIYDAHTFINVR